jgi:integrase
MSKSVYVNLCNKHYDELIKSIGFVLLNQSSVQNLKDFYLSKSIINNSTLTKTEFINLVMNWWKGDDKYLVLNQINTKGLSVRLYKNNFKLTNKQFKAINKTEQGSVYFRYRDRASQKLTTKKLGNYSPSSFKQYQSLAVKLLASNELGSSIIQSMHTETSEQCSITLHKFLHGDFYEKKLEENPKTVDKKVKVVTRNFPKLLVYRLNLIDAEIIKEWLKQKERKLTKRQIDAGESRWIVKPSTLKEAVCTLRSCIELAKEQGVIKDHDLYSLPKFKIDNEIIRYLSEQEEIRLYNEINNRNEIKLENRERTIEHRVQRNLTAPPKLTSCAFADHVSPFIILFKETGIRPGTIMNSRWSDIDFESRFFRIRKSIDKRSLANFVPLNDLAFATLQEWRKHHTHESCLQAIDKKCDVWIFPSPQNPKFQLTTIKTAWQSIIKRSKIDNFRFYDLRHDFASKIMTKTGNIYLVSHLLNHRQIETTKRYAHLMDQSKMIAVQTLDKSRSQENLPTFLKVLNSLV